MSRKKFGTKLLKWPCSIIRAGPERCSTDDETKIAVTVTRKGQVTIPRPVRDRLGIKPGSKSDFDIVDDGRAYLPTVGKRRVQPSRFERMRGTATSGLTAEEIMALTRGEA